MRRVVLLMVLLAAPAARALGPHEIALLVNKNSEASVRIANEYAHARKVPGVNIVHLDLPESVRAPRAEISPEDFNRLIGKPAQAELAKRNVTDHILAWVYSSDFPTRVTTDPPMSLHGMTFVRGVPPDSESIRKGTYRSPLFAGPDREDAPMGNTLTLERLAAMLQKNMPVPAMSLGLTGSRGMTEEEVLATIKYGLISDASKPPGRFYFARSQDVRTQAREWQFSIAEAELKQLQATVQVTDAPPSGDRQIMGLMMGLPIVQPSAYGAYLPGAIGDHLTSFGGAFEFGEQTKLTAWLKAGTVAADGTVTEPFAIWTKFPNARLFSHYYRGVTALEAYSAAVRCPLQLLIAGDPLARPWANPQPVTLVCLADDANAVTGAVEFVATLFTTLQQPSCEFLFLLDGRTVEQSGKLSGVRLDTSRISDGYHELRVTSYAHGEIRHQAFSSVGFTARNRGRGVRIVRPDPKSELDLFHPIAVELEVEGSPSEVALISQERILAKVPYSPDTRLTLNPRLIGEGPNAIQAVALYDGPEPVRSRPVPITVKRLNRPPEIESVVRSRTDSGDLLLTVQATDPENDPIRARWLQGVDESAKAEGAAVEWNGDQCTLVTTTRLDAVRFLQTAGAELQYAAVDIKAPREGAWAGLVFNATSDRDFSFFGLMGDEFAWAFGTVENGTLARIQSIGLSYRAGDWMSVLVEAHPMGGLQARVNERIVMRWPEGSFGAGAVGLAGGGESQVFRALRAGPPRGSKARPSPLAKAIALENEIPGLRVAVTDGFGSNEQAVPPAQ